MEPLPVSEKKYTAAYLEKSRVRIYESLIICG